MADAGGEEEAEELDEDERRARRRAKFEAACKRRIKAAEDDIKNAEIKFKQLVQALDILCEVRSENSGTKATTRRRSRSAFSGRTVPRTRTAVATTTSGTRVTATAAAGAADAVAVAVADADRAVAAAADEAKRRCPWRRRETLNPPPLLMHLQKSLTAPA